MATVLDLHLIASLAEPSKALIAKTIEVFGEMTTDDWVAWYSMSSHRQMSALHRCLDCLQEACSATSD